MVKLLYCIRLDSFSLAFDQYSISTGNVTFRAVTVTDADKVQTGLAILVGCYFPELTVLKTKCLFIVNLSC